jgi:hypothetical protein
MNDDSNLIFERYMTEINEAFQPWKQGRKAAAGLGRKTLARHATQIRARDEIREQNIKIAISNGTTLNILNALAEKYYKGNVKKVKELMVEYTGVGNPEVKTMFNPLEYGLDKYTIPLFDIPNRILAVRSRHPQITGHNIAQNLQRNLLKNYYDLLCDLYRERGGNPDDVNELELVLSFPTNIHHEFKKWGDVHRDVLRPQIFGGESEADRNNEFVHITNVRELQGKNWERLSKEEKIGNLLFWGDPRTPESEYDTTYKPKSAETPENLAGKTLAEPGREKLAKKTKAWPKTKEKKKKEKLVPAFDSTETKQETPTNKTPPTKKTPKKTTPKKKTPTKKTKVAESYQPFIKIIPF